MKTVAGKAFDFESRDAHSENSLDALSSSAGGGGRFFVVKHGNQMIVPSSISSQRF
jgi:hypothetical protein